MGPGLFSRCPPALLWPTGSRQRTADVWGGQSVAHTTQTLITDGFCPAELSLFYFPPSSSLQLSAPTSAPSPPDSDRHIGWLSDLHWVLFFLVFLFYFILLSSKRTIAISRRWGSNAYPPLTNGFMKMLKQEKDFTRVQKPL